jgi:hypothetical protein
MILVYLVRRGEVNNELRHSLRSLVNLPHDRVVFVGHQPKWVDGVEHIPGNRSKSKWFNVFDNLRLACEHLDVDEFVVMNDDFYVMEPATVPAWHRCLLAEHIDMLSPGAWRGSLESSRHWLLSQGFDQPLSYELHVPVAMDRRKLADVLERTAHLPVLPQWRTIYGNFWQVPTVQQEDCKVQGSRTMVRTGPFLSSDDLSFRRPFGRTVREAFPDPSPYEKVKVRA